MKKIITVFLVLLGYSASAQDLITMKDGTDISAKVLEITSDEVKYRLYEEPNGVIYTIKKFDVLLIRYESGRKDIFSNDTNSKLNQNISGHESMHKPNMKYKELASIYNHKDYLPSLTDRYSPAGTGLASFFIVGLGECINGEISRGLGKTFSSLALVVVGNLCLGIDDLEYETALSLAISCYAGALAINVISIVDAVRIAKVKNMYLRDLNNSYSLDIDLYPSVNCVKVGNNIQPTIGLRLAMKF